MKFFPPFTLELTFAMLKPHVLRVPGIVETIRNEILEKGFYIVRSNFCSMNQGHITRLYQEHLGKPYYQRLTSSMSSGPIESYLLAREDAIKTWREMLGPTKVFKAQFSSPLSIRGRFGMSDTRNVAHGADSPESVVRELSIFFPDFSVAKWYEEEEKYFRNGFVSFSEDKFMHIIDSERNIEISLKAFALI